MFAIGVPSYLSVGLYGIPDRWLPWFVMSSLPVSAAFALWLRYSGDAPAEDEDARPS